MNRRKFCVCAAMLIAALTAHAQTGNFKLDVQTKYTGSGTVDESHKVYVALWDTPDFMKGDSGSMPLSIKGVTSKSDVAQFSDISKSPVYISLMYDSSGKWDAASPPPAGASLGIYAKEPGTPARIDLESGKTTKISAELNDSFKMQ